MTFDADGGTPAPEAQRVAKGGTATAPATAPAKAGCTFAGWKLNNAAYDFDTVLSADIELVAAWTKDAPQPPAWAIDADETKFNDWVEEFGVSDTSTNYSDQYLMNVAPSASVILQIESINVTDEGTQILIGATANGSAEIDMAGINGVLNITVSQSIAGLASAAKKSIPLKNLTYKGNKAEVLIPVDDGKFVKASVDYTAGGTPLTEVGD